MRLGLISYELSDVTARQDADSGKSKTGEKRINALPENAEDLPADIEAEIVLPPMNEIENDLCDHYVLAREVKFEVEEVKEVFEKKKKRRNYIEFRNAYEKG
ncbi:MAG: hypothetical protein EAX81_01105 [Candidatus Thorarchaeota archaeon]|nr:hypothetical protein [Candidatus Thorarchaeota archaeon]